jgi:hypothetical protein
MAKKATTAAESPERPVIVTTTHRGVFFGWATNTNGDIIHLRRCRMCIAWGTTRGFMQLAESGPTSTTRLSAPADIEIRGITSVTEVTADAADRMDRHD